MGVGAYEGVVEEGGSVGHYVEHVVSVAQVAHRRHRSEAKELAEDHHVVMEVHAERVRVEDLEVAHARAPLGHLGKGCSNSGASHCCCNAKRTLFRRYQTLVTKRGYYSYLRLNEHARM